MTIKSRRKIPLLLQKLFILSNFFVCLNLQYLSCESEGPDYFKFFTKTQGKLRPNQKIKITGHCFRQIDLDILDSEKDQFVVKINANSLKNFGCIELLIISTGKTSDFKLMMLEGESQLTFNKSFFSKNELEFVNKNGFFVFRGCDDVRNFPIDFYMTVKLFIGGWFTSQFVPIFGSRIPEFQLKANIDFVKKSNGFEWKFRDDPRKVLIDASLIRSGDLFASVRFDGVANIAHVVSGSVIGHCAIAMWDKEELYIIDTEDGGGNLRKGIKKTKYKEWIHHLDLYDNSLILVPLKDEILKKFNTENAWTIFTKIEGLPYGYESFLFSSQDTLKDNKPDYLDSDFIGTILNVVERYFPSFAQRIAGKGYNKRINSEGLSFSNIWEKVYEKNTSFDELNRIVENENWKYENKINLICSALVVFLYKAAGLFGNLKINSQEFTPYDLFSLNFFEQNSNRLIGPCKGRMVNGYCQLMGRMLLNVTNTNLVEPYDNMAENCPSIPPLYERTKGC